jgi:hypothetical protein
MSLNFISVDELELVIWFAENYLLLNKNEELGWMISLNVEKMMMLVHG